MKKYALEKEKKLRKELAHLSYTYWTVINGHCSNTRNFVPSNILLSFAFLSTEICTPGYCLNGGICKPVGNMQTCICQPGFSGDRCEKKKGDYFVLTILCLVHVEKEKPSSRLFYLASLAEYVIIIFINHVQDSNYKTTFVWVQLATLVKLIVRVANVNTWTWRSEISLPPRDKQLISLKVTLLIKCLRVEATSCQNGENW